MYALVVLFTLPEDTDWDTLRQLAHQRADLYTRLPGLRAKAFILAPERRQYGGQYIWETREALDTFLASDLFANSKARFGEPALQIFEIPVYLSQGAITSSLPA